MDEKEKIESYLVEVVGRLFDTQQVLEAIQISSNTEKQALIRTGSNFAYQQAAIDIATELYRYATGEDDLQEIMDKITAQQREVRKQMQGAGMEFQ